MYLPQKLSSDILLILGRFPRQENLMNMKLIYFLLVFPWISQAFQGNLTNFSEVICSIKWFTHSIIILTTQRQKPTRLCKKLFQECSLKVRIVSDFNAFGENNLVSFVSNEIEKKVVYFTKNFCRYKYDKLLYFHRK